MKRFAMAVLAVVLALSPVLYTPALVAQYDDYDDYLFKHEPLNAQTDEYDPLFKHEPLNAQMDEYDELFKHEPLNAV